MKINCEQFRNYELNIFFILVIFRVLCVCMCVCECVFVFGFCMCVCVCVRVCYLCIDLYKQNELPVVPLLALAARASFVPLPFHLQLPFLLWWSPPLSPPPPSLVPGRILLKYDFKVSMVTEIASGKL